MNDRERLIEILDTAKIKQEWRSSTGRVTGFYHAKIVNSEYVKPLVELLIANGVTVQKQGRWEDYVNIKGVVRCSECNDTYIYREWVDEGKWHYCPNCGAKMDLEVET